MDSIVVAPVRYGLDDGTLKGFGQAPPDERLVTYHDQRGRADQPTLEREGFTLVNHTTTVQNFEDGEQIAKIYLPEVRELMRSVTGASAVYMQSNWVLRAQTKPHHDVTSVAGGKHAHHNMKTGGFLHMDFNAPAADLWTRRVLADAGVAQRPRGRLLLLTAWRAISAPPQDKPLALLDRRTVREDDLIREQISLPHVTWHGYQLKHNPEHRFCWWSDMTADEVILFSNQDDRVTGFSAAPHTAFDNPNCPPGSPTRHSIEVRGYCFLDE